MYIISKYRDYYDCLMKQGVDKTIIYHRNEEYSDSSLKQLGIYRYYQEFVKKTANGYFYLPDLTSSRYCYPCVTINTGLLGFCGKQYLVMRYQYKDIPDIASCSYPRWIDKLKQTHLEGYRKMIENAYTEKAKTGFYYHLYGGLDVTEKNVLMTLNKFNATKIKDEFFIELNCPVFFIYLADRHNTVLIKNPPLKPLDFQCVLPPESCFQEIAHYISNFLTVRDNPLQITDDKILCVAKGFDIKTSFRKASHKTR